MTLFQNLKSIFLHLLKCVRTPIRQYASCVLVDVDDTLPSIFSSDIIGNYVAQRAELVLMVESDKLIPELEAAKSNTQELYHSSKSLKQRLSVVLKTVLEEGVQRFTSLFGTKK